MLLGRIVQFLIHQRSKSDNKAFLLIRPKKYQNPHENRCSKVISKLISGNILHESSSAPQQHKSVQYKWFALYLHRDVSHTYMLQPHFSAAEAFRAGGNMRGSRNFCQFYLILSLFYSLQRGSNGFIAEKLYLYFTKDPEGSIIFRGGVSNLFQGVQMLVSIETHIRTCYFPIGGGPDPLSPSGSACGQCHHNGTIFITVPLLTMIAGMLCQD